MRGCAGSPACRRARSPEGAAGQLVSAPTPAGWSSGGEFADVFTGDGSVGEGVVGAGDAGDDVGDGFGFGFGFGFGGGEFTAESSELP